MLIFTRRAGESFMIGDDIKITCLESKNRGNQIRIGIEAPENVAIHRTEIYNRIQKEKEEKNECP